MQALNVEPPHFVTIPPSERLAMAFVPPFPMHRICGPNARGADALDLRFISHTARNVRAPVVMANP